MPGLFTAIGIESVLVQAGTTIDFSVGDLATGPYRVTDFDWQPQIVGSPSPRLQSQGSWPTWRDIRLLSITMEGTIVGDSPGDYWNLRLALAKAVIPPEDFDRAFRYHGTLTVDLPSIGEVWAKVNLVDFSMPLSHATGTSSKYQFTWNCDLGYWTRGVDEVITL